MIFTGIHSARTFRGSCGFGSGWLGEIALADKETVEIIIAGGGVMVLQYHARESTRDLDCVVTNTVDPKKVRAYAAVIAGERGWPKDWLNDAVKGYLVGPIVPTRIYSAPGIQVFRPSVGQLLAMKLGAWRDDVDIADAERLLSEVSDDRAEAWAMVKPFLQPGRELKAKYAFDDLWENRYGDSQP